MCLKLNSKIVGIIGGGQLGMMLAMAIKSLVVRLLALILILNALLRMFVIPLFVHHMMMRLPLESYVRSQML